MFDFVSGWEPEDDLSRMLRQVFGREPTAEDWDELKEQVKDYIGE